MASGDEFERWLLDSAREDAPPPDATARAWASFAATAGTLGSTVSASPSPATVRASRATAAKWAILGALGGGAMVALWLRGVPSAPPAVTTAPAVSVVAVPSAAAQPSAEPSLAAQLPPPQPSGSTTQRDAREVPAKMRSTLAAEVALLDAVRRSLAASAHDEALRALGRYERRFPAGLLASDAEVLTIEALGAKGEGESARARAARFLAKHPNDPHTERVRALAAKP